LLVRKWLWSQGYRYRLHRKDLPGKPDIVFARQKKVIFVHGCFWHKHDCHWFKWPKTNEDFWKKKINGNFKRDQKNYHTLIANEWNYFVVWECKLKHGQIAELWEQLSGFMENQIFPRRNLKNY